MMGPLRNKNVRSMFFFFFSLETQSMIGLADKGLTFEDGRKARRGIWALGWQYRGGPSAFLECRLSCGRKLTSVLLSHCWAIFIRWVTLFNEVELVIRKSYFNRSVSTRVREREALRSKDRQRPEHACVGVSLTASETHPGWAQTPQARAT